MLLQRPVDRQLSVIWVSDWLTESHIIFVSRRRSHGSRHSTAESAQYFVLSNSEKQGTSFTVARYFRPVLTELPNGSSARLPDRRTLGTRIVKWMRRA